MLTFEACTECVVKISVTVMQLMELTYRNGHLLFPHKHDFDSLDFQLKEQRSNVIEFATNSSVSISREYVWVENTPSRMKQCRQSE